MGRVANKFSILLLSLLFFYHPFLNAAPLSSDKNKVETIVKAKLAKCPITPNCICSEFDDSNSHYLAPIPYSKQQSATIVSQAKQVIVDMGGEIITEQENHLVAEFTSSFFRFVDDFEVRKDDDTMKLHFRSASRLGISDFGVNKKRALAFILALNQALTQLNSSEIK